MTLTPIRPDPRVGAAGIVTCDISRIGPASIGAYLPVHDPSLNVLLFIPFGVMIGQLDRRQHRGP